MATSASPSVPQRTGFTLIEILFVVVILGILAAIVIPQFTSASRQSREAVLREDLRQLRTQLVIYLNQHDVPPDAATLPRQLTLRTNSVGEVGLTDQHRFGPYLSVMPINPITGKFGVRSVGPDDELSPADDEAGWIYREGTAAIYANAPGEDSRGIRFIDY